MDAKRVKIAGWGGEDDLSAAVSMSYDDDRLYLNVKVKDDRQFDYAGDAIWNGDGVQVAFSGDGNAYGPEYGFSYGQGTPSKYSWNSGNASLGIDAVAMKASRDDSTKITTYDIAIRWVAISPESPGKEIPFTLLVNDNDGSGRKGYAEWTPGIGNGKEPESLGTPTLLEPGETWGASLRGPRSAIRKENNEYTIYVPNFGARDAKLQLVRAGSRGPRTSP